MLNGTGATTRHGHDAAVGLEQIDLGRSCAGEPQRDQQASIGGRANRHGLASYRRIVGHRVDDSVRRDASNAAIAEIRNENAPIGRHHETEGVDRCGRRRTTIAAESDGAIACYGPDDSVGADAADPGVSIEDVQARVRAYRDTLRGGQVGLDRRPAIPAESGNACPRHGGNDSIRRNLADSAVALFGNVQAAVGRDRDAGRIAQHGLRGRSSVAAESLRSVSGDDALRSIRRDADDQVTVRNRDVLRAVGSDLHIEQDALTGEIDEGDGSCQ